MASRLAETKVFDYCLNPIHVVDDSKDVVVPCGKCAGCLLHKSNDWSFRLQDEIQHSKYSVFFTLTYNNDYLPVLLRNVDYDSYTGLKKVYFTSNHIDNIRSTLKFLPDGSLSKVDKVRNDDIIVDYGYPTINPRNYSSVLKDRVIPYASKRDIQLYLKLLRRLLDEKFKQKAHEFKRFRYFIISEYGETFYRPHYHGIIFFQDFEVSEYFAQFAVYACWQMCDKDRTLQYVQYCNSGTSGYLTQYVNSIGLLPKVYQDVKQIRPFRLSSKSCSVGYNWFDKAEVSEKFVSGNDRYFKSVPRLGSTYVFRFPSNYLSTQFPKCFEYGKRSYSRLLSVYGMVFYNLAYLSNINARGYELYRDPKRVTQCCVRLRKIMRSQDVNASLKCFRFCVEFGCTPSYFLYVLDLVWYRQAMHSLKHFYEYQQNLADRHEWLSIARMYQNFADVRNWLVLSDGSKFLAGKLFLESLSLDVADFDTYNSYSLFNRKTIDMSRYEVELEDILNDMVKKPKYNTLVGISPDIV